MLQKMVINKIIDLLAKQFKLHKVMKYVEEPNDADNRISELEIRLFQLGRRFEEFDKKVKEIENIALDFAESQLHKQISEGNTTATIFLLKTKGKKRGYIERQEIQHDGSIKSTLIEWNPPQEEKLSKDATDNSTTLSNQKKDSKSIKEEQDQEKQ